MKLEVPPDDALEAIADKAMEKKPVARALRSFRVLKNLCMDIQVCNLSEG